MSQRNGRQVSARKKQKFQTLIPRSIPKMTDSGIFQVTNFPSDSYPMVVLTQFLFSAKPEPSRVISLTCFQSRLGNPALLNQEPSIRARGQYMKVLCLRLMMALDSSRQVNGHRARSLKI